MPKPTIDTGLPPLDDDLRQFFEVCESDAPDRVRKGLAGGTLSKEQFAELVPDGAFRAASLLTGPLTYKVVLEEVRNEAKQLLERARELARTRLGPILEHPLSIKRFRQIAAGQDKGTLTGLGKSLNAIYSVQAMRMWVRTAPGLSPAIRIAFVNASNEPLLDSTFDWDNLLFVIKALTRAMAQSMEEGQTLARSQQIGLPDLAKLAERIRDTEKYLAQIKALAPTYGIDLGASPSGKAPAQEDRSTSHDLGLDAE